MKKVILLIAMLSFFLFGNAQTENDCFQYIKKLDVPKEVMALPNSNPASFWWYLPKYNAEYQKLKSALKKGKETARNAVAEVSQELLFRTDVKNRLTDKNAVAILDSLNRFFNLKVYNPRLEVCIVGDEEVNAYSTPDAIIRINNGLLKKMETYENLYAVVGHELAHYALDHVILNLYAVKKKEKRNQIAATVAYGVSAVGNAMLDAAVPATTKEEQQKRAQRWQDISNGYLVDLNWATKDAYGRYYLKYSRSQEIEADIASYRFLQWMGEDPNYVISMLEIIGKNEPKIDSKKSDHPSAQFRINILKAIAKYDEANKVKSK